MGQSVKSNEMVKDLTHGNWIKDLLSMVPSIRTKTQFPPVSLSHQEVSISLLSSSIRGQID